LQELLEARNANRCAGNLKCCGVRDQVRIVESRNRSEEIDLALFSVNCAEGRPILQDSSENQSLIEINGKRSVKCMFRIAAWSRTV
jgi:hypothetical protein